MLLAQELAGDNDSYSIGAKKYQSTQKNTSYFFPKGLIWILADVQISLAGHSRDQTEDSVPICLLKQ